MKHTVIFLLFFFFICLQSNSQAPPDENARKFLKKYYKENQKELDKNTSGIGIEFSNHQYGKNYQAVDFKKINIRAKRFEFLVGVGDCYYYSPLVDETYNMQASNWAIGFNQPISALGLGRANSTKGIRLLPFFAADFGHTSFKVPSTNQKLAGAFHLTAAPGYRLKIPYLIIDFRLNTTINMLTEENFHEKTIVITSAGDLVKEHSFKRINVTPSISIILDGLFSKFKPKDTRVSGSAVVYDKVTTEKFYTTETYNQGTGKMEKDGLYKTETTYQYHTESISLPVSDIGAFVGIGPRLVFKPVSQNSYRMPSLMGGLGIHGRISLFSADINVDKGVIGYSSQAKTDGKIFKNDIQGKGIFDATNITGNIGIDLGPAALALLGIVTKRDGETPYFSFSGGVIYGYSFISKYTFKDAAVGESYANYFANNPDLQTKYNDVRLNKSGAINGWYIGADVGAVGFRYEFNKYKNAPLARCAYYTISYKFPLLKSKD